MKSLSKKFGLCYWRILNLTKQLSKNSWLVLLIIIVIAMALRVVYNLTPNVLHSGIVHDELQFDAIAWNLRTGHGFSLDGITPTAYRTPVVPFVIMLSYVLFGHSYTAARIFFSMIDCGTVVLVYLLAKRIYGAKVAILSSLIMAISPYAIQSTGFLLSETTLGLLLIGCALVLENWRKSDSRARLWWSAALGIILGLTVLTRGETLLLLPLFAAYIFIKLWKSRSYLVVNVCLFGLTLFMALFPWILRNYFVFHAFVPLSTNGGEAFWGANNTLILTGDNIGNWAKIDYPGAEDLSEVEQDELYFRQGIHDLTTWLMPKPWRSLELIAYKMWYFLMGYSDWRSFFEVPLAFGMMVGLFLNLKKRQAGITVPFLLSIVATTVIFYGSLRLRLPYDGFFVIMTSYAIVSYVEWRPHDVITQHMALGE